MDFKELLSWLITTDHNLELFSTSVWLIWTQRNQVRMSQPNISVHQILTSAKECVTEFKLIEPVPFFTRFDLSSVRAKWCPPNPDMVKINCDGATFKEQKKSGIGVIIRDSNGLVMASMSKLLPQQYTPLEIETMVASSALEFAVELGFSQAILEMDSQVLTNALRHNSPYLSSLGLLIDDIRCNARCFNKLLYSHAKRKGNKVAHNLARHSICISDFMVWMETVPPPFVSLVLADIAGFY
nr:uncharacterized protein LOC112008672 [Quercus suber]